MYSINVIKGMSNITCRTLTSYLVLRTVNGNIVTTATDLADPPISMDSIGLLECSNFPLRK